MDDMESGKEYTSSVTLIVTGFDLDPDAVTKALRASPSQFWRRGEKRVFSDGSEHVYSWGGWKTFPGDQESGLWIEDQIKYWLKWCAEKSEGLKQVRVMNCSVALDCYISTSDVAAVRFDAEQMRLLGGFGIDVAMNIFTEELGKSRRDAGH